MFDIGFSEMMVIAVVALIVIGPERLPRVARTMGHLVGRLQRYVSDVKADINREIELDEIRKFQKEVEETARSVETDVNGELRKAEESFASLQSDLTSLPGTETPTNAGTENAAPGAPQIAAEPASSSSSSDRGTAPSEKPPAY